MPSMRRVLQLARSSRERRKLLISRTRGPWFRLARNFTPVVATSVGEHRYFVSTRDPYIGYYTFMGGTFDDEALQKGIDTVRGELPGFSLEGRTVFDVGANIGTQTIPFVREFGAGRVVALEPDPANVTLLRQNVLANGIDGRVDVVAAAVTDFDGSVDLELSGANPGDHRVRSRSPGATHAADRATAAVQAVRLDTIVADVPALIWMDTQGHEGQVLAGATKLLERGIPVITEYWPYGLGRAGGLDLMHQVIAEHFATVIDLRSPWPERGTRRFPAGEIASLAAEYPGADDSRETTTDLVLIPRRARSPAGEQMHGELCD